MTQPLDRSPFGHRPEEHVFGAHVRRPPSTCIRVAAPPRTAALPFEPECGPQAAAIKAALAPPPVPRSNLAFEPDEGEPRDRVARHEATLGRAPVVTGDALADLINIAASGGTSSTPLPPRAGARNRAAAASIAKRPEIAGDLEAEMFVPSAPERRSPVRPVAAAATGTTDAAGETTAAARSTPTAGPSRGWISVFTSDHVAGRKKKRGSTIFRHNTAVVTGAAGRAFGTVASAFGKLARRVDATTSAYRLPLANLASSAIVGGLVVALGVPWTIGLGSLGACLLLSVAGQPARNLLGFAGIIMSSAALAEIVRQRERFFEILLSLF